MADGPWTQFQSATTTPAGDSDGPWKNFQSGESKEEPKYKPQGDVKNAVERMGTGERLARGFAYGSEEVGRGLKRVANDIGSSVGLTKDKSDQLTHEEDVARQNNAALMKTPAGRVGSIGGGMAATGPAALIPGAGSMAGAAVIGGALGAAQPLGTNDSRLKNTGLGALGGVVGQKIGQVGGWVAGKAMDKLAPTISKAYQTMVNPKGVTPEAARALKSDYILPPSMAKAHPTAKEHILEGIGGKIRTEQQASIKNQINSNTIARKEINMPLETKGGEQLIRKGDLIDVRSKEGMKYEAIKNLDAKQFPVNSRVYMGNGEVELRNTPKFNKDLNTISKDVNQYAKKFPNIHNNTKANGVIEDLRQPMTMNEMIDNSSKLRQSASDNFRSRLPENLELARVQKKAAEALDGMIEEHLTKLKNAATDPKVKNMFSDYINARKVIAKTYDIQAALDPSGNVDAIRMSRIAEKRPLSGGLAEIAHFGAHFKGAARVPTRIGSRLGPAVSKAELGVGVMTGAMSANAIKGIAKEIALAGSPATARSIITSKTYQNTLKPTLKSFEAQKEVAKRISTLGGATTMSRADQKNKGQDKQQ